MRAIYILLLCSAAVLPRPGLAGNPTSLAHEIDRIRVQHGVSAAVVIVVDNDEVLLEHYSGVTDWDSPRTVDRDTYFRLGSVTKVFTALALLRAEEQGKLSLQQEVAEILGQAQSNNPWANNPWAESNPLRVVQLMEHTAGWYDMSAMEFDDKNPTPLSPAEALAKRPESRVMHWPFSNPWEWIQLRCYSATKSNGPWLPAMTGMATPSFHTGILSTVLQAA